MFDHEIPGYDDAREAAWHDQDQADRRAQHAPAFPGHIRKATPQCPSPADPTGADCPPAPVGDAERRAA
jgi:hypothetical protein